MMLTGRRPPRPAFHRAAVSVLFCALILVAGCASQTATPPASQSPSAAPSPSASAPASPSASATPPASIRRLAVGYLVIARPANHRLDHEVDGFGDNRRDDLAKANADLRAEAATEVHFDRQLSRIPFPAAIAAIAGAIIRANQSRIILTRREARSATLAGLRSFTGRHKAADAAVEVPVRAIRKALACHPPRPAKFSGRGLAPSGVNGGKPGAAKATPVTPGQPITCHLCG
jgi:hypothetical protein